VNSTITIRLDRPLRHGSTILPSGAYALELDEVECEIALSGPGSLRVRPDVRNSKVRVRRPEARLADVRGEARRLLIVRIPPATEWLVSFDEAEGASP
jgi:hypothetical protein